jgi:hypothetical protein
MEKHQRLIMYEHILNLTIDIVNLASRDLLMCLLTFNSRKFFIEIVNQFSTQIEKENEALNRKYADLLNLLDSKEVFSYKTSSAATSTSTSGVGGGGGGVKVEIFSPSVSSVISVQANQITAASASSSASSLSGGAGAGAGGASVLRNPSNVNLTRESNIEDMTWIFQKFKQSFYEIIYKFSHANYLKDSCLNNCIDFYLNRKLLPRYGNESIKNLKELLEKYFR